MEDPQPQPDFLVMAADMDAVATEVGNAALAHASIATNLGRMVNVPAFNQGAAILEAINALSLHMNNRFDSIEYNSIARHTNGHVNHSTTPLTPLRDPRNQEVAGFPTDLAALANMNAPEYRHGCLEQQKFIEMEASMNNTVRAPLELATNLGKMRNIPALDAGGQILAELRVITERLDRIESRFNAADYNAVARFTNNTMAVRTDNRLVPLKTQRNEDIPDFPMTLIDIDRANSAELNRLLESYGLPTAGTVAIRKTQLKHYLEITVAGV